MKDNTIETKKDAPRVFVIIPTHNRWDEAHVALTRLLQSDYPSFEVVLVDDGCTDGTARNCQSEFPSVTILEGDGNLWWSGAINLGTQYARDHGADLAMWI